MEEVNAAEHLEWLGFHAAMPRATESSSPLVRPLVLTNIATPQQKHGLPHVPGSE
jgi:hypothetical protein